MLEKLLSKTAFRIHMAIFIVLILIMTWGIIFDTGIPAIVNRWQASMTGGSYFPAGTLVFLAIPILMISYPTALIYDLITRQGIFEKKSK